MLVIRTFSETSVRLPVRPPVSPAERPAVGRLVRPPVRHATRPPSRDRYINRKL